MSLESLVSIHGTENVPITPLYYNGVFFGEKKNLFALRGTYTYSHAVPQRGGISLYETQQTSHNDQ